MGMSKSKKNTITGQEKKGQDTMVAKRIGLGGKAERKPVWGKKGTRCLCLQLRKKRGGG